MHLRSIFSLVAFATLVPFAQSLDDARPVRAGTKKAERLEESRLGSYARTFSLQVLHNNDGESKLTGIPGLPHFGGISRFANVVKKLRAEHDKGLGSRGTVMLSSGDNFLAGTSFQASLDRGIPYYDSVAMNAIGYDALCLGNHDFDFGPQVLANFINSFNPKPKFLSANLDFSGEPALATLFNSGVIAKSTVINVNGRQVGVIGATTAALPSISSPGAVTVDPNYAAAINAEAARLERSRVNVIILVSHLQSVAEDVQLSSQLQGVDIMIAGGGDEVLANPGQPLVPGDTLVGPYPTCAAPNVAIPIITTGGDYKYVGRLVADFDVMGNLISINPTSGPVRVAWDTDPSAAVVPSDAVEPDATIEANVTTPVSGYVGALYADIVGVSNVGIEGRRGTGNANPAFVVPGVRTVETNGGNLLADALLWTGKTLAPVFGLPIPTVGLQNGGGIRNNTLIPAGNISVGTTFDIAAFANFVSVVPNVSPSQFKEILENAYSRVEFADGRFAQVAGFSVIYDQDFTAQLVNNAGNVLVPGQRVREIKLDDGTYIVKNGAVEFGAPSVSIATIDFLARGGDQYPYRGLPFGSLGKTYQQALREYIEGPLGGIVNSAQYPVAGNGRITRLN